METRCKYLRSLVKGCPGRMVDDKKFLQGAQPARLGDRVVVRGPAQDVPGDGVWDVGVLQAPHEIYLKNYSKNSQQSPEDV